MPPATPQPHAASRGRAHPELDALYRDAAPIVLRRAERMLGVRADAEDVVHEVFVRLFERGLAGIIDPLAFVYRATTHACLARLRDAKTRSRLLADAEGLVPHQAAPLEVRVLLDEALRRLPRELQEVAVYYHLDRMTQEEIAEVIGCSRRSVSDHLTRIVRLAQKERHP